MTTATQPAQRSWLAGKRTGILFSIILAALVLGAAISLQGTRNLVRANRRLAHTLEVLNELESTYVALRDAETIQRVYIITGQDRYRSMYPRATQSVDDRIRRLRKLVEDNPRQQDNVDRLEATIRGRLETASQSIAVRRDKGFEAARAIVVAGRGIEQMDAALGLIAEMRQHENGLLVERSEAADRAAMQLLVSISAALTATLGLSICVYWLNRRNTARQAQAAEELLRSTERFRLVVESCPSGMILTDQQGVITMLNARAEQMFGYSRHELVGRAVELLLPDRFRGRHPEHRRGFMADPRTRSMGVGRDLFGLCKDGTEIPIEIGLNPIQTDEGLMVLSAIVDITERKRAEEKFRLAVESCPSGMIMIDRTGTMLLVNAETEQMFGYRRDELIGHSVDILVPERFRGDHPVHRETFMSRPESRSMGEGRDLHGARKNGSEFPVEIGLHPIHTSEGLFVLAAIVDITQRKRAEEEERKFTLQLKRSNRELQDFAYVASHDLQEPLRKIQAFGDRLLARCGPALSDEGADYVDRMQNAATRMRALIDDLLRFSRVTTQAQPFQPVDLNVIVREVLDDLGDRVAASGGHVETDTLPAIDADPIQMRQLFQNLLGNALKFRRPDAPLAIRIRSAACETDVRRGGSHEMYQIEVQDNGIGFEERFSGRIFEMFQRLNERSQYEGSGIGLAICRKIVERHGGRIVAHGQPNVGATFAMTLPAHQSSKLPAAKEPAPPHPEEALTCASPR